LAADSAAMNMTANQINYLNIFLMLIAGISAFLRPFETFLFAYAFLGPAHYLTEISWLHDRNYFTKRKYDWIFLLFAGVVITLANLQLLPNLPQGTAAVIVCVAFFGSLVFVLSTNTATRMGSIVCIASLGILFVSSAVFDAIFAMFLPTLIHVFIFTGLFILVGAMKSRSVSGILSLLAFVAVAGSFFYLPVSNGQHVPSDYVRESYGTLVPLTDVDGNYLSNDDAGIALYSTGDGFIGLNDAIRRVFYLHKFGKPNISYENFVQGINDFFYRNPAMLAIMAFIAFAYLYHYLNWFSKTSVIQWHNIPRSRFMAIIVLWLASIGLYAYDYAMGLKWLFFLSFAHVLLEFPLNQLTFINIGKEIGRSVSRLVGRLP
jgi:hypothetical protein